MKRRIMILILCLALLPAVPASAAGDAWGEPIAGWTETLAEGAELTGNTYWTGSDYRAEHYIEYTPGVAAALRAVSGDVLCSNDSLMNVAAALEARGEHALAGVNGGYYTFATLEPVGVVAQNGALRCDDEGLYAVGFLAGGGAVIGRPGVSLTIEAGGEFFSVERLNRTRGGGLALFTADFDDETHAAGPGWNIVCVPDGDVPLRGSVTLTVERVEAADGGVAIPEGRAVLSLAGDVEEEAPEWLDGLESGEELTLHAGCAEGWEEVDSALGVLYPLVLDGAIVEKLDSAAAPRSAVGVRADGTVVLYTVDGRQSGYSVGAGLDAVARRMKELGCVAAGALDGGASTNLSAVLPGDSALSQINSPSGGSVRKVVNYILLTTEEPSAGAERLALYPKRVDALVGAEIELSVKAADWYGHAEMVPENLRFTVSDGLGSVKDGVFIAEGEGTGTITVSADGLESASIPVRVIASPDSVEIYGEVYGRRIETITLAPGQEVDFTARAMKNHVLLQGADECFTWEIEPAGGALDETGHLIPGPASASAVMTVRAGETVREAAVKVWSGVPFEDVAVTDGFFDAVKYVYDNDIFKGTGDTVFEPETVMNRGMLVTVLWRMNGEPEAENALAFFDVSPEDWYGPAVAWASGIGLVNGYGDGAFGPLDDLTREQILAILYRYAEFPEPADWRVELRPDVRSISDYAYLPLAWAAAAEMIDGDEDGNLLPREPMTRAAVAEVLMRYLELPAEGAENTEDDSGSPLG